MKTGHMLLLTIAAVAIVVLANALFVVKETQQALVVTLGKIDRVETEAGLHIKIPFYQQISILDKRILQIDSQPEELQAGDKKRVVIDSFTRWRIVDGKRFFETVTTQRGAEIQLNNVVNSAIRRVVARNSLNDLVSTDRAELMNEILGEARREAEPFGIEVIDVRIKRADLPEANASAVFARMRTEREQEAKQIRAEGAEAAQRIQADAERQRTIVLAEAERDAQKLRGEGDGEAIKVFANAFNKDPEFYKFVRSLEAYENSLQDGETLMILDPSVNFLKPFKNAQ